MQQGVCTGVALRIVRCVRRELCTRFSHQHEVQVHTQPQDIFWLPHHLQPLRLRQVCRQPHLYCFPSTQEPLMETKCRHSQLQQMILQSHRYRQQR